MVWDRIFILDGIIKKVVPIFFGSTVRNNILVNNIKEGSIEVKDVFKRLNLDPHTPFRAINFDMNEVVDLYSS